MNPCDSIFTLWLGFSKRYKPFGQLDAMRKNCTEMCTIASLLIDFFGGPSPHSPQPLHGTMPGGGQEPELDGLARMVANGAGNQVRFWDLGAVMISRIFWIAIFQIKHMITRSQNTPNQYVPLCFKSSCWVYP